MGFEGSLDTVSFGDILNTLCNISKEGVLIIQDNKQRRVMHFRDNGITLIGGSQRVRLGDMIVQAGKLQAWELENALAEQQQTGTMLGEILVSQGVITEEELEELICEQIEQEICDIFFWENAYFNFYEGPPKEEFTDDDSPITLMFDVQSVLLRIADQIEEWEEIRKDVPSFAKVFVIVSEDIELTLPENESEENLEKIIQHLDGTKEVNDIIKATELPTLIVCRILSFLTKEGIIRETTFEELMALANDYHEKGHQQRCIQFYEKALSLQPENEELLLKIAQLYEAMGAAKAGEFYFRLGTISSDHQEALRYIESAISYMPKAVEPREKLLELAEYLDSEKKEIHQSKVLAQLYQNRGDYQKAVEICDKYFEKYPKELDYQRILIQGYISQEEIEKAIEEYEKLATTYESMGNINACIENLEKIQQLSPNNEEIAKRIKHIQRAAKWTGKKHILIPTIIGGILLLAALAYGGIYCYLAGNLLESAKIIPNDDPNKKLTLKKIIANYPWSPAAGEAKTLLSKFKEPKERGDVSPIPPKGNDKGEETPVKNSNKLPPSLADLLKRIDIACRENKLDRALNYYNKFTRSIKAAGSAEKYKEYQKKAKRQIQKSLEREWWQIHNKMDTEFGRGVRHEEDNFYTSSLAAYGEVIKIFTPIRLRELPKEFKTKEIIDFQQKMEGLNTVATQKKQIFLKWENEAKDKLLQAGKYRRTGEQEKTFAKVVEIIENSRLGKTSVSENITIPYRIETEPSGAKIKELKAKTPCDFDLPPRGQGSELLLTIKLPGFESITTSVAYEKFLFSTALENSDQLNSQQIPQKLKEELAKESFILSKKAIVKSLEFNSHWMIIDGPHRYSVVRDYKKQGHIVNIYFKSPPIIKYRLKKNQKWQKKLSGRIWGTVKEHNGQIIMGTLSNKLYALDPETGSILWEFVETGLGDISGSPAEKGQNIYFGSSDQNLYALGSDGNFLWKYRAKDFIRTTPDVDAEYVYFTSSRGSLFCLYRKKNAKAKWVIKLNEPISSSPKLWGRYLVVTTRKGSLILIDKVNGRKLWKKSSKQEPNGPIESAPLVNAASPYIYVGNDKGHIYQFHLENRKISWIHQMNGEIRGAINVFYDHVYVGTKKGYFAKISKLSGRPIWEKRFPKAIYSKPLQIENSIYVACMDGKLYILDAKTGDIIWQKQYSEKGIKSDLVIHNETIYLATEDGTIYALPAN